MVPHFEKVAHLCRQTEPLRRHRFLLGGKFPTPSFLGSLPNPQLRKAKERNGMDNENEMNGGRKREIMLRLPRHGNGAGYD